IVLKKAPVTELVEVTGAFFIANFVIPYLCNSLPLRYNLSMHIGVLTHNYPRFPGDFSGTFVEALCQEFARQQQQVTIWAPYDPAYQSAPTQPGFLGACNTYPPIDLHLYRYIWPERLHQLGYMRSMQADLELRREGYLLGPNMVAAGLVKVLREVRRVRPDLLHAHWLLPNGFIGAVVSKLTGIPLVISVPGSDAQIANANPFFRLCARFAMRQARLMTANSADLRDAVATLDPHVLDKFELIIYGTDPNALQPDATGVRELRAQWHIQEVRWSNHDSRSVPFTVLCVGRMVYKKGFDTFIRALAEPALRDRNIVGIMVGEGDQKAEWQALAAELGVADRLRWVGNIPKDQIAVYYNACDVLINPAVRKPIDGLNVCVLDAMSCGKPVVGSTVAGNPLAIVDGETGFLVPEGEPLALALALARLVDDPTLVAQMGKAARGRIECELGWPPLVQRYINYFQDLLLPTPTHP
ncbi:MAG: glycosyltransferase, partial [Caldilineaceae bacterium]|nr:glycosyltransferase [Caldilineaceae bacterium]